MSRLGGQYLSFTYDVKTPFTCETPFIVIFKYQYRGKLLPKKIQGQTNKQTMSVRENKQEVIGYKITESLQRPFSFKNSILPFDRFSEASEKI